MPLRLIAGALAPLTFLTVLIVLFWMGAVAGLAPCENTAAVLASGAGECIQRSAGAKAVGMIAGFGAALTAALAFLAAIGYARRGSGGSRLAGLTLAIPVLAGIALILLPVSF